MTIALGDEVDKTKEEGTSSSAGYAIFILLGQSATRPEQGS